MGDLGPAVRQYTQTLQIGRKPGFERFPSLSCLPANPINLVRAGHAGGRFAGRRTDEAPGMACAERLHIFLENGNLL
jgi:hypothetical protein